MSSLLLYPVLFAQLPLAEAGQLLLIALASFALITLGASIHRFHRIIQLDESALPTPEACDDFFYIQITRYFSKINRASNGFAVLLVQFIAPEAARRNLQETLLHRFQSRIREQEDKTSLFRSDCIGIIIDTDEQNAPLLAERLAKDTGALLADLPEITGWRMGASCFPLNGGSTRPVLDAALEALEQADFNGSPRFCMAPAPEAEEAAELAHDAAAPTRSSPIDPLTGVLKPRVTGSYIRKYLAELRQKKIPACLFCIEINRIEDIHRLHGEIAAEDVLAGVSQVLQRLTREADLIGRYGENNFLLLAPCTLENGERIARRLRDAVQQEQILSANRRIKSSIRIGIAICPDHGRLLRDLFPCAQRALEIVRDWNTSACLVYNPQEHAKEAKP